MYAFDLHTGAKRWVHKEGCVGGGGPTAAVWHGLLYTRSGGRTDSANAPTFDPVTGTELGHLPLSWRPPAAAFTDGLALLVESDGNLHGIDLATGRPRWSFHASSPFGTSPIVVNGFAYIVSLSGDVYALKAQTGVPAWAGNLGDRLNDPQNQWNTHNSLAAAGNILFVPTSNHLLALDHP